ncbi:protein containing DUF1566 [Candidatus Magnetobacterium bavaricum]|uniref:Protein containing DUF1566 n=1 Tax=Candidatus Magnetobacterium bavaricum TaxID=29290 RepID=A0A0F3GNQ5_9BACT|nr:protein containing DUF1566 [Candidatus Magnetobacterium bavaricum]
MEFPVNLYLKYMDINIYKVRIEDNGVNRQSPPFFRLISLCAGLSIVLALIVLPMAAATAGAVNLPQTGQTTSYAAGDDGAVKAGAAWPTPRFKDNGNDTITDRLTGLMWTSNANAAGGKVTWQEALNLVDSLNKSASKNYTNWRLPNVNELESLINAEHSIAANWLNKQGFKDVQPYYYWSSTSYVARTSFAWVVGMGNGIVFYDDKIFKNAFFWPVRTADAAAVAGLPQTGQTTSLAPGDDGAIKAGAAWPTPRFKDNGNGTITDNLTTLVWTKDASTPIVGTCTGGIKNWQEALDYVRCLNAV